MKVLQAAGKSADVAGSISAGTLDSPRRSAAAFGMLHLSSRVGSFARASQAPGSDHVVGPTRSKRGQNVRRFTLGEENDATRNQTLISLEGEVTAQAEVKSSC